MTWFWRSIGEKGFGDPVKIVRKGIHQNPNGTKEKFVVISVYNGRFESTIMEKSLMTGLFSKQNKPFDWEKDFSIL